MNIEWMSILEPVVATLGVVLLGFATKWLQNKTKEQREKAGQEGLGRRQLLKTQALESLLMTATNIANKELVELKDKAKDGKVTKDELKVLGEHAINTVKSEFKRGGIDLAKELGDEFLSEGLRYVVDKMRGDDEPQKSTKKKTTKRKR